MHAGFAHVVVVGSHALQTRGVNGVNDVARGACHYIICPFLYIVPVCAWQMDKINAIF
jgi:hypothetical protein